MSCRNCQCDRSVQAKEGQSLPATVEVRMKKDSGKIMTGRNTEILIDGHQFPYATSFKFEVDARGIAKCYLEFLGNVSIKGTIGDVVMKEQKGE